MIWNIFTNNYLQQSINPNNNDCTYISVLVFTVLFNIVARKWTQLSYGNATCVTVPSVN